MNFSSYSSGTERPSPAECRSKIAFSAMLLLVLMAVTFPEMPPQALQGILWTCAGCLMLLLPPETQISRWWIGAAVGFVVLSSVGLLPREWFEIPSWRKNLEFMGIRTGPHAFVQPALVLETMCGFTFTAVVAVYLLGHRIGTRAHQQIALAFTLGIGLWAGVALRTYGSGETFGFFPNRNHTATLLNMGTFAGLGCLAQAIRRRQPWNIVLACLPTGICLYALLAVSESRAGIVLMLIGLPLWFAFTGVRQLSGNTGKALALLVLASVGIFLIVDSKVKTRLEETVVKPHSTETRALADISTLAFQETPDIQSSPPLDGRLAIYRDTLDMMRNEPWTGVGAGQFSRVFPQYRQRTNADNNANVIHPESDWLWMLTESGWPATICLAAAIGLAAWGSITTRGSGKVLRMASLTAGLIVGIHGIFDVPGHRVGICLGAVLLVAISLRPLPEATRDSPPPMQRWVRGLWRGMGLAIIGGGLMLLFAQHSEKAIFPTVQARHLMESAQLDYNADQAAYEKATAEGKDYQPTTKQDPLERALRNVEEAIEIAPLDPHQHFIRGALPPS
jgi:O-antigen ligase